MQFTTFVKVPGTYNLVHEKDSSTLTYSANQSHVQKAFRLAKSRRLQSSTSDPYLVYQVSKSTTATMAASMLRRFLMPSVRMPLRITSQPASAPQLRRNFSSTPTPFATYNQVAKVLPLFPHIGFLLSLTMSF
jgi:hypothetical protein